MVNNKQFHSRSISNSNRSISSFTTTWLRVVKGSFLACEFYPMNNSPVDPWKGCSSCDFRQQNCPFIPIYPLPRLFLPQLLVFTVSSAPVNLSAGTVDNHDSPNRFPVWSKANTARVKFYPGTVTAWHQNYSNIPAIDPTSARRNCLSVVIIINMSCYPETDRVECLLRKSRVNGRSFHGAGGN